MRLRLGPDKADGRAREWRALRLVAAMLSQLVLTLVISWRLLPGKGAVDYGDSSFLRNVTTVPTDVLGALTPNYLGQDQSATSFLYLPRGVLTWGLSRVGIPDSVVAYALSFGLVLACAFTVVVVVERVSRSALIALAAGAFVQVNGLSIDAIAFGGFAYFFTGTTALVLLMWRLWVGDRDGWSLRQSLLVALTSLLVFHPFFLAMYLIVLAAFFVPRFFGPGRRQAAAHLALSGGLSCALASYWLLPLIVSAVTRGTGANYDASNLQGVYQGFVEAARPGGAVRLLGYPNSTAAALYDGPLGIVAAFVIFGAALLAARKIASLPGAAWLLGGLVLFLSLGLGPDSVLTGSLWGYAWDHTSLVHFFRSFTRFLAPVPLLLVALLVLAAQGRDPRVIRGVTLGLMAVIAVASAPALTGDVGGALRASQIPGSYARAQAIVDQDPRDVSLASYPSTSYELYSWNVNPDLGIAIQSFYLQDYLFTKPVVFDRVTLSFSTQASGPLRAAFQAPLAQSTLGDLRSLNVGLVLVHKDFVDVNGRPVEAQPFLDFWDRHARTLLTTPEFTLFRIDRPDDLVGTDQRATVRPANPSRIDLELEASGQTSLRLNRNFDSRWRLYALPVGSSPLCPPGSAEPAGDGTRECSSARRFDALGTLLMRGARPVPAATHERGDDWANSWAFDAEQAREALPSRYSEVLPGGGIRLRLVMLYQPQRTQWLALLLSALTILGVAVVLLLLRRRARSGSTDVTEPVRAAPVLSTRWTQLRLVAIRACEFALPVLLIAQDRSAGTWANAVLVVVVTAMGLNYRSILWVVVAQVTMAGAFEVAGRDGAADVALASVTCLLVLVILRMLTADVEPGRESELGVPAGEGRPRQLVGLGGSAPPSGDAEIRSGATGTGWPPATSPQPGPAGAELGS